MFLFGAKPNVLMLTLIKQGNGHECSLYYSLVGLFAFLKKKTSDLFAGTTDESTVFNS